MKDQELWSILREEKRPVLPYLQEEKMADHELENSRREILPPSLAGRLMGSLGSDRKRRKLFRDHGL